MIISLFLEMHVCFNWNCVPAGRSRTAGRKVQQKSVGAEVEETTETETEREGTQLNGRRQGDFQAP